MQNLPDYYFLGFPIKELLKSSYSDGYCHACAVALSLYFKDFEIVTCNLVNYLNHYNQKASNKIDEFEHTFLVIKIENKEIVIDTTFGMITDKDTYKYIFNPNKVKCIDAKDLKNTEIYQYIKQRKDIKGPSYKSELKEDEKYKEYEKSLNEYMNMCKKYVNPDNEHLQDFINRCLFQTSNTACFYNWRTDYFFKPLIDHKIEYPATDLFSLEDDEFDMILSSRYKDSIERNQKVLESYHEKKLKQKILKLVRRYH